MKVASKNLLGYSMYIKQVLIRCGNLPGSKHEVYIFTGLHFREILTYNAALQLVLLVALFVSGDVQSPQSGHLLH